LTVLFSVVAQSQLQAAAAIGIFVVIEAAIYFVQTIRVGSIFQMSDYKIYGELLSAGDRLGDVTVHLLTHKTIWVLLVGAFFYLLAHRQFRRSEL